MEHLFEKKDYSYALFFGHLAVEKMLKALYVSKAGEHAPHIHNLVRLAEKTGLLFVEVPNGSMRWKLPASLLLRLVYKHRRDPFV